MLDHHAATVRRVTDHYQADSGVLAVILGGSVAHGFARPDSDIDISVLVTPEEYRRRAEASELTAADHALATYDGGYVDAKFVDVAFLRAVAERGSDPARWAYDGARVLFSREPLLGEVLEAVARFPVELKDSRRERFVGQLLAWQWLYGESEVKADSYLATLAAAKLVLFSCRLVLVENEMLYPFHKWLRRVTATAPHQPDSLADDIETLLARPDRTWVEQYLRGLLGFYGIDYDDAGRRWPGHFLRDTELAWLTSSPAIDDE